MSNGACDQTEHSDDRDTILFHTPPLLHSTEDAAFDCLRLLRSRRVGPTTYHRLMREHGSATAALDALPDIAAAAGVADYTICPEGVIAAELKAGKANGATLIVKGQPAYPAALNDIDDTPPILWAIGDLDLLHPPMISLVGARNASSLGTRMAKKLAADLGDAGLVVVSGMRGASIRRPILRHSARAQSLSLAVALTSPIPPRMGALPRIFPNKGYVCLKCRWACNRKPVISLRAIGSFLGLAARQL